METVTILGLGASVFTLLLVSGTFFVALVAYIALALAGRRPRSAELAARGDSVFLPLAVREYWDWTMRPVERALIRSGISADAITIVSLLASFGAAVAFAFGWFGLGGWLYILSGTLDMFDGRIARAHGTASRAGAFLDSTLDRYTELAVLGGLAWHFNDSWAQWAAIAAMIGSLMVSYTRARGEGLGYSCREGGMQRAERIVYLGLAGVFGKVAAAFSPEPWDARFIQAALLLLAVSTNLTAIFRLITILHELRAIEAKEKGGVVISHPMLKRFRTP